MAAPKNKSDKAEIAIKRLFDQMEPELPKRRWGKKPYAALITYCAEECGAKFATKDGRKAFREIMEDSDFSFSSNFKKYATARGFLPASAVDIDSELD